MEDALTHDELVALAVVLLSVQRLDPAGAKVGDFDVLGRVRVLPLVDAVAPYREQAPPSAPLDADTWVEIRARARKADEMKVIRGVQREDARAIIYALAYDAAVHCAISPGEAELLRILEREWDLAVT